jgi:hypothetical protein
MPLFDWIIISDYGIIPNRKEKPDMYEPSPQLRTEISSLQWLNEKQLKDQYAALIPDAMSCPREDLLRSLIAYRLQEKFYGIRLSDATKKMLQKTIEGDKILSPSSRSVAPTKHKITRNWKGVNYEVTVHSDGRVEYEGKIYRSLTAVAKVITGSHWNGPVFFGVKQ